MDLGERISILRKERGLSQEKLGELVGVSRQAVSKWESDQTVPDVENCVAISRALGVTLGSLLALEEAESGKDAELNEEQLKMVEAVADKYLERREKPRRRWRWPVILAACALLVGAVALWEWLSGMDRTINYLSGELSNLQGSIVSGVGDQVKESLEQQTSLITDSTQVAEALDLRENTITYRMTATLKSVGPDTKVTYLARSGGKDATVEAAGQGQTFTGLVECPLTDEIKLYLVVEENGASRTQILETMYQMEQEYAIRLEGGIRWTALQQSGLVSGAVEPVQLYADLYNAYHFSNAPTLTRLELVTFVNDAQVSAVPIDLSLGHQYTDNWSLPLEPDIPADGTGAVEGDTLTFAVLAEDNYERRVSKVFSSYKVLANGKLEVLDWPALDNSPYGLEVWE